MKTIHFVTLLILFFSCNSKKDSSDKKQYEALVREIVVPEFQTIIDSVNIRGSILIYDLLTNING